jgi:sigma-B regulation protein RsbU (phosphoserine phosphatase)
MGLGALWWLEPRLRKRLVLTYVAYGFVVGAGWAALDSPSGTASIVLIAIALLVPFFVYDLVLSYVLLERRDLAGELAVASRIQSGLFPTSVPQAEHWECAGHHRPARSVGGDYWDVIRSADGRTCLVVADVAGKGVPAAILMSGLRARLRVLVDELADPAELVTHLNRAMEAETEPRDFATLQLVVIDGETRSLTCVNAGHPPGLLVRDDGEVVELTQGGLPVGMLPDTGYDSETVEWRSGDRLVLYSDGVLDVSATERGSSSPDELLAWVRDARKGGAEEIVDAVRSFVHDRAAGEMEDDVTVLACAFR